MTISRYTKNRFKGASAQIMNSTFSPIKLLNLITSLYRRKCIRREWMGLLEGGNLGERTSTKEPWQVVYAFSIEWKKKWDWHNNSRSNCQNCQIFLIDISPYIPYDKVRNVLKQLEFNKHVNLFGLTLKLSFLWNE